MKKKYILLILLKIIAIIHAEYTFQFAPQQGNATDFTTQDISSDYGRRFDTNTKWHKGVDYVRPYGNHLLALDGGSVHEVYCVNTPSNNWEYKVLKINGDSLDYGFGHIFYDGNPDLLNMTVSGMRLKRMENPYSLFFAIIIDSTTAIGLVNGATVINGADTLIVTNTIDAGDRIAPLGNAASSNYHVHLYCFMNGFDFNNKAQTKDPLEFINHAQPNYDITIDSVYTVYPGDSLSSVKVRCKMLNPNGTIPPTANHYNNVTMNIDNVELLIKKDFELDSAYDYLNGNSFESKIIHGARFSTTRYPSPGNPSWCNNTDIANTNQVGSFTKIGIDPYAYRDPVNSVPQGYPWDDFYFSDIFLRIDKDLKK